ncbi:phosphatidylserine decarboxylase family protein [Bacteroidota bacterium]
MIHKEGRNFLIIVFIILITLNVFFFSAYLLIASFLLFYFILSFFRSPKRETIDCENIIYAPADGKIVVIEETTEKEYLNKKCIQVSIFMSVWNVHINWIPISGSVNYFKYHKGKYLVARHPKSSTENERATIAIKTKSGIEILIRQIAGYVARRVKTYVAENEQVKQGNQLGFIKFGSRVDVFIPLNAKICVKLKQQVKGTKTIIAEL